MNWFELSTYSHLHRPSSLEEWSHSAPFRPGAARPESPYDPSTIHRGCLASGTLRRGMRPSQARKMPWHLDSGRPAFESWLCLWLAVWSWTISGYLAKSLPSCLVYGNIPYIYIPIYIPYMGIHHIWVYTHIPCMVYTMYGIWVYGNIPTYMGIHPYTMYGIWVYGNIHQPHSAVFRMYQAEHTVSSSTSLCLYSEDVSAGEEEKSKDHPAFYLSVNNHVLST